ncbi:hypothetical protein BDA96_03G094400 [Sorghum bicolor]|uniref:SIAH-type domain-containing protein n=1 Tax=Sorghum bicolor TaxID=4558 RepID=A0A921RA66_SORBI|nr:hypothetical protein BDA96_03G094400 [Sorghum bicolor]
MSNSDSSKQTGEAQQEERNRKRKDPDGAATSVTMELEVLDCPICYGPLQPPIFQIIVWGKYFFFPIGLLTRFSLRGKAKRKAEKGSQTYTTSTKLAVPRPLCAVGHLICSSCRGKLQKPKKCHHCSCESSYNRCHGVEKIIESIQVPCSNTSFSASTGLLQEHFTTEHHWPSTKCKYGWCFYADVKEGVHVISSEDEQLFLLNIASEPFGCVISVFCVQPHDTEPKSRCAVTFSFWKNNSYHSQSSEFQVPSTTLSDGLPREPFLFILPRFYMEEDSRICITMKKDSAFQREETDTSGADYSSFFSLGKK